ncbi:hypothetical protein AB205_0156500 [Aquarana catesbeiana]|uniref:Uncharacterized protein n=1 Tax=Aquarana catesbeiana TaxID=8400 RepID=A0A2G9RBI1_AQUCT|nr:hypothetical protein AB205_0156500 [Aquarana catesbeiana]
MLITAMRRRRRKARSQKRPDPGALVWDTRTPFLLGGPIQVLQCIL